MDQPLHDSLPYHDIDLDDPVLRARIEEEITRELKKKQKSSTDARVPPDFTQFKVGRCQNQSESSQISSQIVKNNEILAAELERIKRNEPLAILDTSRYALNPPSEAHASEDAWKRALDNAHAQVEHQGVR
jgi:pre-mRNA-splicing factor SPF27